MAKKGGSPHYIRITAPSALAVKDKKGTKWLLASSPGPHPKSLSLSLGVMMRDVLEVAGTLRECKHILSAKHVLLNGKATNNEKIPVGLMDIISMPAAGKHYRMTIRAGKLVPSDISATDAKKQLLRVVKKHTVGKGKVNVTLHNGRNMVADNDLKVGDSVLLSLPDMKVSSVVKLQPGCRCLIVSGKHAGEIAQLEGLIERKGSMDAEAKLKGSEGDFVTVAKYLFALDSSFN